MKTIAILGSTGSVGTQALDVVRRYPERFRIVALSANKNIDLLIDQIKEFNPEIVAVGDREKAEELQKKMQLPVYSGEEGLIRVATCKNSQLIFNSLVGSVGVRPTYEAILAGKDIALANKESLVVAGDIIMKEATKQNISIMPVDSEHSAIFQCLNGERRQDFRKILLTCSGGPFRGKTLNELKNVTVEQALDHPNWNMGGKITIDSSTLMNKGLEVIEAHHLFGVDYEKIEVVVHPQSIIHSMVEFVDASVTAQLAYHDMRLPIVYALSYPSRLKVGVPRLDFFALRELTFYQPDLKTFNCLDLAIKAGKKGGIFPCVLNGSNEIAVEFFLDGKINWVEIGNTVDAMMKESEVKYKDLTKLDIDKILHIDKEVKQATRDYLKSKIN